MDLTKSLPKVACVDTLKKCNEIEPFSKTVLNMEKIQQQVKNIPKRKRMKSISNLLICVVLKIIN